MRQVFFPRCGKLQLQVAQNRQKISNWVDFSDRLPDQTITRRTTSWRILLEAAQTLVRWGRCCTPSCSPSYRWLLWWFDCALFCQKWERRKREDQWYHRRGSLIPCCPTWFSRRECLRWASKSWDWIFKYAYIIYISQMFVWANGENLIASKRKKYWSHHGVQISIKAWLVGYLYWLPA